MKCHFKNKIFTVKYLLRKFEYKHKNELMIIINQNEENKFKDEIRNIFNQGVC